MTDWLEELLREEEPQVTLPVAQGAAAPRRSAAAGEGETSAMAVEAGGLRGEETLPRTLSRLGEETALTALYRRAGEALGMAAASRPARREIRVGEAAAAPVGLTARELDLAVRRDSRRYDGAMESY